MGDPPRDASGNQPQLLTEQQELVQHVREARFWPRLSCADHEIEGTLQPWTQRAKSFSRQPSQACPRGRRTGALGDREAKPWLAVAVSHRAGNHAEVMPLGAPSALKHPIKVRLVPEPTVTPKRARRRKRLGVGRTGVNRCGRQHRRDHFVETDRRRRPFVRRRANTARPFLVAMRARKPCVRRREILLGLPRPFFTLRSSVHGLARRVPRLQTALYPQRVPNWPPIQSTSAKAAGAEVYTNRWKMRVPCRSGRANHGHSGAAIGWPRRSPWRSLHQRYVTSMRQHVDLQRLCQSSIFSVT